MTHQHVIVEIPIHDIGKTSSLATEGGGRSFVALAWRSTKNGRWLLGTLTEHEDGTSL